MKKYIIEILIVIVINVVSLVIFHRAFIHINPINSNISSIDTTYNRFRIDSIEIVIHKQDSIIYDIKEDANKDILESLNDDDSAAVSRFLQLVYDNFSYGETSKD